VKIRGIRIEPDEVTAVLERDPAVARVAVVAREDRPGDRRLVAYVVPIAGPVTAIDTAAVRDRARELLPQYMVPSAVVALEQLPLTANGKLDRAALPAPDYAALTTPAKAAATAEEQLLCELFAEVLGVPAVGVEDSFFDLGGHSMLAMRLISRMRTVLATDLGVRDLFHAPSPRQLSRVQHRADKGSRE
jgi:hypothetical protein